MFPHDLGASITQDASGRILVTGVTMDAASEADMTLWRYEEDGSLDLTFGGRGWVVYGAAAGFGEDYHGRDVTVDSSGAILVSGQSVRTPSEPVLWRYHPDGTLDTTFGVQGVVVTDIDNHGSGEAIVLDSCGRVLVWGQGPGDPTVSMGPTIWRFR